MPINRLNTGLYALIHVDGQFYIVMQRKGHQTFRLYHLQYGKGGSVTLTPVVDSAHPDGDYRKGFHDAAVRDATRRNAEEAIG